MKTRFILGSALAAVLLMWRSCHISALNMGHVSLEETLYYIHLLPERLKSSPGIDWKMLNDIYQTEEGSDEED